MVKQEVERQLDILTQRAVDLVNREALGRKIERSLKENKPLRIKLGADPSAPDLHLGHMVALNKLREFQDLGHTVVFIIGDFTAMIGDPSGKSKTRPALSRDLVREHAKSYQDQVFKVLRQDRTEVRYNSEWLAPLTFEDLIRLTAHVTVAQMLARDDFSKRYAANQSISLVEFLYPMVQAYDSVMIRADVELGGTDQLFNLLLGRELQQVHGQEPQVVMTLPLLEGLDGVQKMSKSLGNYIGVAETPRDMFGKAMSVSDELMWRYFSLILCMPDEAIAALRDEVATGRKHPRAVKDEMARRLVAKLYSEEDARAASEEFARVFSNNELPDNLPELRLPMDERPEGKVRVVDVLVRAGLAKSNGEARRLIQQGAVRVGEEKVSDPQAAMELPDDTVIRSGKRGFVRVRV